MISCAEGILFVPAHSDDPTTILLPSHRTAVASGAPSRVNTAGIRAERDVAGRIHVSKHIVMSTHKYAR